MAATWGIWAAAALSGAAALAYEICWSRALVVPLGNSADAAALVLAGFMLGIAAGARAFGGLSERVASPLRVYALLEVALALYALVAPRLLGLIVGIGATGATAAVTRSAAALVLVGAPGLAMGATLPLLVRALTGKATPLRYRIGIAYGANTVGAAAGALATGFWGIAELGQRTCSAAAAGASALAAALALAVSFAAPRLDARAEGDGGAALEAPLRRRAALFAAFVGGFVMLACELVWSRILTFVFGHDTYAFASLLAFVLLGLGLGGLGHRLLARRDQAAVTGALLGVFAAAVLASFWVAAWLVVARGRDPFGLEASGMFAASLELEIYRELTYAPVLVLLPSVIAGALFPAACSLYGGSGADSGRSVGTVALVNGVGSALGAVVAGLWLVVPVGIQGALALLACVAGASGALVLALALGAKWPRRAAVALAPLAATAAAVLLVPRELPRKMLLRAFGARHQTLLHYDEARTGTVSVIQNQVNDEKQLLMNAVNEVTTRLVHDQSFKALGHLGPLLHPSPRKGLMICLGAGLSAGAAARHPLERLDVVDLSSAVAGGARWFGAENNGVLDDPVFRLHIGDGRQFLLNTEDRYDLAMIDSTHPKSVDSWILYTREFYATLHDRLGEGGMVVQWLPLHGLSEREFQIVVRTFQSVFPEMTLWANVGFETYGHVGYAKLVGVRGGPLVIDYDRLAERLADPRIRDDLAPFGMASPAEILDLFVAGPAAVARWTEGLPVQTDDHPMLPYTTSFSRGRRMEPQRLLAVRERAIPFVRGLPGEAIAEVEEAWEAQGLVVAGLLAAAVERRPEGAKLALFTAQARTTAGYYAALAERYRDDPETLFEVGTQLASLGLPEQALPIYERAFELRPDDFRTALNLALLRARLGETERALEGLVRLRARRPRAAIVHHNLGAIVLGAGDPGVAAEHLRMAVAADPESIGARLTLGEAYLAQGDLDRAEAALVEVLARSRWVAEAHHLLGLLAALRGHVDRAIEWQREAAALDPYRASYHHHLGLALHAKGRFDEAAAAQVAALDLDPGSSDAAYHLGLALRGQGRAIEAVGAFCLALQLEPGGASARAQLAELGRAEGACVE